MNHFAASKSYFRSVLRRVGSKAQSIKNSAKAQSRKARCTCRFEQLEARRVLAAAVWHNAGQAANVNGDNIVSPLDVLLVINEVNGRTISDSSTGRLPTQTPTPVRDAYFDVSCDGIVSGLDVLQVINHINAGEAYDSPGGLGVFPSTACSPRLTEGFEFTSSLEQVVTLPSESSALKIWFQAPEFDVTSRRTIRDAFEIELTDMSGNQISAPYLAGRDAIYNWSESLEPVFGAAVSTTTEPAGQDSSAMVNLSSLPTGTKLRVQVRLVNNDGDIGTNVLLRGFEIVSAANLQQPSNRVPQATTRELSVDPLDFTKLDDITSSFAPSYGRTTLAGSNDELITSVQVTNLGSQAVTGRILVAIDNISELDARLMRPDGILPDGRPYLDLTQEMDGQPLLSGATLRSRELAFRNTSGERFTYRLSTLGTLNSAPNPFTSTPLSQIEAERTFVYVAEASDPEQQSLDYSIVTGPANATIDSASGQLRWVTTLDDIGSHNFIVRATDPHGLFVEQTFTLEVVTSLQNRPPNFVSDPVTDAIASSGFEIATVATGDQPADVAVISGFRGPRLVSINAGDQTVSVHAGQNNDRFDDTTVYSTGEPKPTGALIDVGYSVDVGLPAFLVSSDRNEVLGMDQGDFNGDGILDLVVMTARFESTKPQGQRNFIEITRMLGDGDGNFGSPTVIASIPTTTLTNSLDQAKLLTIADIDGDGRLDVTALQESTPRLVTVRGLGDGSFEPALFNTLATPLNDYRLVDLDQDGSLDIVGRTSTFVDLGWMRGAGDGTFAPFASLAAGGGFLMGSNHSRPYDFADIDGDGDIDIVNSQGNGGNIIIWLNDGSENFTVGATVDPPGSGVEGAYVVHVADFTGDGRLDIFTINANNVNRVELFVRDSTGLSFTYQVGGNAFGRSGNLAGSDGPVDIDGDGDLDIILANNFSSEPISPQVLINDGQGSFTRNDYLLADFPGHILANQLTNRSTARGALFGDFNRDGVIDLAYMTSDYGGYDFNGVGIRLGTRPGEFGATRTISDITLNRNDNEVHAADFNGDGAIDLLTLSNARMALGNGDGTFQPSFPAASIAGGSDSGVVADFNLDGILDYVATRGFGNGIPKIYAALGNGDGTFDATLGPIAPSIFYNYSDIRQVDFNNDGYPDLIAKAGVERFIDVYLNDPANPGTFAQSFRTQIEVTGVNARGFLNAFASGDFDGDGNIDFVAVDQLPGEPQKLVTFSGDGAGNFAITQESFTFDDAMFQIAFYYPGVLQSGDVNGDGLLDIVSFGWHGAIVHIGNGVGTFTSKGHYPLEYINSEAVDSYLIDFDQDGHLDLVHYAPDETLSIRVGKGDGTFGEPQRVGTMGRGDALTFADIDNDGHLDIAMVMTEAGNHQNEDVVFYYGTRNGLVDQVAVDLDGDGNEEVLAVNEANDRLKIFVGDNLDRLNRQSDLLTGRAPQAVATGDLNGDGQLEIITANRTGRSISIFSGSLAAGYTSSEILVGSAPIDVLTIDINGDGHTDVLVLDDVANAVWILSGSASGVLSAPVSIALGDKPGKFTVADANGDGQLDAVITLPDSNRLMIVPRIGIQPASPPIYVNLSDSPSDVQVTDLNADGNADLATTLHGSNFLSILYGRGNNQFARAQNISVGDKPTRVTLADADEDGRMDLIVANSGDNTASVIYNRFDPNEVYRYDSDAIDPDNDTLSYSIVDGPGGLIINSQTGALLWAASPDQVGEHSVTISADDGRGGIATQSFKIDVQPARDNALPLIATEPNTKIGAGETFTYQANALDNDRDTLLYSLIDAPAGATIDPTTGQVTWDARADLALSFAPHGIDSTGRVEIEAHPSLQPASLTAEGWYNFTGLPASNGRSNLIYQAGNPTAYALYNFGNAFLRLELDYPSPTNRFTYSIPYVPTANSWTHFAITIDDSTLTAKIFVDGVERGSTALPGPIGYNSAANAQVGENSVFFTRAIIDNYRLWNVVRTPAEIAEGLSQHYDGDTRVVLDYRFDEPQTLTVRDYSPAGNDGYRRANGLMPVFVPGLAETGSHQFTIGVEDGRGGFDQQSFTLDIVPELRGSIRGQAFSDLDGNGSRDASSEPAMPGAHLFIDANGNGFPDPAESQTITDASGNYQIDGLLPGQYPVQVSPIAGVETPSLDPVSVTANQASQVDLAIEQLMLSQIRGQLRTEQADPIAYWKVFADLDLDNERDENEPMAMSDRDGNFAITGLSAGNYTIRAELPAGWTVTGGANGQNVTLAADAISEGNHFTFEPTNTSVAGGVHFVTMPTLLIEARQTFRYASVAMGIHSESITYDLSLAPDGMSIDPATGLMAWRPTIAQVGEHLAIVRATNASGSISLHDFTLTVFAPNTLPVLSHEPVGASPGFPQAYVGLVYAVNLSAQDAESQSITYSLLSGPSTATLNNSTGELRWTPTVADVGNAIFSIELRDSLGATSIVNATVAVINSQPSATPFAVTLPRTQVGLGQNYFARIQGYDALDRPLTWSLVTGPTGLLVTSDGAIRWSPGNDDLDSHSIVLQATNVDGTSANSSFTLEVVGRPVNTAPSVTSEPATSTTLGKEYQYDVQVLDRDADPLSFALINAPVGMSIHPSLGTIRWTPAADQLGESDISIQVTDPDGATAAQEFKLKVSKSGGPPAITSIPPTEASVGGGYLYSLLARDAEGDPLTFRLLAAPAGMTITQTTGVISWTPQAVQVGQQDVVIEVSDGVGGAATQAFAIRVSSGAPNLPPVINSTAPRFGTVGTAYSYSLQASDPESTAIVYSLGQAPAGMTINASSGAVAWTPTAGQAGKFVVTLIATDAGGASAVESFELDVLAANSPPTIASTAPVESPAGAMFTYQVLGRDVDLDQLTYQLTTAPVGATIDSFGKISWPTTPALIGPHNFVVRVSDPRGGVATQSFTLNVIEDLEPPKVSIIESLGDANRNILPWQGPFVVYVRAIDNVAVRSLTLKANGQDIPLDAAGTATFTFEDWRFQTINATATAVDTNGNITSKTITFDYDFPEGWSGAGTADIPTVAITSPTDTAAVFGMVTITGTASHDDFAGYKLSYRRIDETTFTEFHESTTAVVNGELGVWDTSLLINDEYVIRLEAASNAGVVNVVEYNVGLSGELKLGNFQLTFTDMVVPVAGIPIEITRIYDTLQADREGDFGYGWRLEYRNTDLRVGLPKSGLEDIGIYTPLRAGVKVYLNIPGQGRQGFTFNPEIRVLPGIGGNNLVLARPRFTPDRGVTSSLSTGTSNYLQVNEFGELYAPGGIPYNPASSYFGGAYTLTTKEGTSYRIDAETGKLNTVKDTNGNQLQFAESGITSNSGIQIEISRDIHGRIVSIRDLLGNSTQYSYSSNGDLIQSVDREGNTTQYVYLTESNSARQPHFLDSVVDPLGRTGAKAIYGEDGRLSKTVNVNGAEVQFLHDPANSLTQVVDRNGNAEFLQHDNTGRITSVINAGGFITEYTYDSQGNRTSTTDAAGNTYQYRYDASGNLVRSVDPLGGVTVRTFDSRGNLLREVNALGQAVVSTYDARGNLLTTANDRGEQFVNQYDARGNILTATNANGDSVFSSYDARGNVAVTTDLNGLTLQFSYNQNGHRIGNAVERVIDGQTSILQHTDLLDRNDRPVGTIDALGNRYAQTLDANGNIISTVNAAGRQISIVGHDRPVPEQFTFADQTQTRQEYDNNDNVVATMDQLGNVTRYAYDTRNNLIAVYSPDDTPNDDTDNPVSRFEYDARGNQIASIDPRGNRTESEFDQLGRRVLVRDPLGNETRFEYDALGNNTVIVDPLNRHTQFVFDSRGNQVEIRLADGSLITHEFDGMGNLIARTDANNNVTRYSYNAAGMITKVVDAESGVTTFEYDTYGNLIAETDANGNRIEHQFDDLSRRIGINYPDGSSQRFNYVAHNLGSQTDFSGSTTSFEYDEVGRVARVIYGASSFQVDSYDAVGRLTTRIMTDSEGRSESTAWLYNAAGQLIRRTEADGTAVDYEYDAAGNLTSVVSNFGSTTYTYDGANRLLTAQGSEGSMAEYEYDPASQIVGIEYSNGLTERRTYDLLGRLVTQTTRRQDEVLFAITYRYDADGNVIQQSRTEAGQLQERFFTYDRLNRLVEERLYVNGQVQPGRTSTYQYDAVGNRVGRQQGTTAITYSYDSLNRMTGELRTDGSTSILTSYEYNPNGQLVRQSDSSGTEQLFNWTPQGWLSSVVMNDATGRKTIEYRYSGDGLRTRRIVRDSQDSIIEETGWLWNVIGEVPTIIAEYQAADMATRIYVYGHEAVAISESGTSRFYHQDIVGSTIALSEQNGALDASYSVDAFGFLPEGVSFDQPIQFAGEFVDEATGLSYLRARDLDRSSGRFLSIDPQEGTALDPMSRHDYVYAHSNPLRYVDPTGNASLAEQTVKTAIVSTLALIGLAGIQQIYAHTIGGDPVNWQGLTASATFGATWGPDTGYKNWSIGATGGFYLGLSVVSSSPYTRTGEPRQSWGAALVHFGTYAGVGGGYSPFSFGLGLGSINVNVPGAQWLKDLGSAALAPFYALLADVNASAGVGRTPHSKLWMGFGHGSASGASIGNSVGVSLTFVGALTIPLPSVEMTPSELSSFRYLVNGFS